MLARDMRHVISHDQRQKLLKQIEEEKAKKLKEAEELREAEEKAKEEAKKKKDAPAADPFGLLIVPEEEKKVEVVEEEEKYVDLAAMEADWVDEGDESAKSDLTVGEERKRGAGRRSFGGSESGSDDGGGSSSDESIDFDNLPEDRHERFALLGIDPAVAECGDEQIIMISEASAIEELMR